MIDKIDNVIINNNFLSKNNIVSIPKLIGIASVNNAFIMLAGFYKIQNDNTFYYSFFYIHKSDLEISGRDIIKNIIYSEGFNTIFKQLSKYNKFYNSISYNWYGKILFLLTDEEKLYLELE